MMGGLGVIVLSLIVVWGTYERSHSSASGFSGQRYLVEVLSASVGAALAVVAYALAKGFVLLDGITPVSSHPLRRFR